MARFWNTRNRNSACLCQNLASFCLVKNRSQRRSLWPSGRNSESRKVWLPEIRGPEWSLILLLKIMCPDTVQAASKRFRTNINGWWKKSQNTSSPAWTHSHTKRMKKISRKKNKIWENWRIKSMQLDRRRKTILRTKFSTQWLTNSISPKCRRMVRLEKLWNKKMTKRDRISRREKRNLWWSLCSWPRSPLDPWVNSTKKARTSLMHQRLRSLKRRSRTRKCIRWRPTGLRKETATWRSWPLCKRRRT